MAIDLTAMRADTDRFLTDWGESMTRTRLSVTYDDAGAPTETWGSDLSFTGDWQPLNGQEMVNEAGLEIKSEAKVITTYDEDIVANDRISRSSVTYRVNYTRDYEDHKTVFIYREVQQ